MAKFTAVEYQLLSKINHDRLCLSLGHVRQAMEDIWATDAPRIIQDYTDHGMHHCERLANFAAKLLEANDGSDLSSLEMYLLLAGIYLHDIGMQCDVVKFPEIKSKAEELGAIFEIEFTAKTTNGYSIEEQKIIRKNHQYLSAAWIDYAYRTGKTILGPAVKTIPEDLVADLRDVCKFHSKLPINDCPLTFNFDSTGRKQLVSSLLRFSDELDIDVNRVSIETVKNFSLDPYNSVYWWLHNRTKVVFSARNMVTLTIRLNPEDIAEHGSFIKAKFITEFETKNRPVLSVLIRNLIPIVIDDASKVVEDDLAEPLPIEIVKALQAMQQKGNPLIELAGEIRIWLQAIHYEISDLQQRDDRTLDMFAVLEQGAVKQRVLVRCIGGEITLNDLNSLDKILDRKTPQGWLISDKRVSDAARKRASEDDAFKVFNLSGFLQQMVWGPYLDALKALVDKNRIPELYVNSGCYKETVNEKGESVKAKYDSLDDHIDDWLKERGKMHISLLGEFGSGKTWFSRHYCYRQLDRFLKDPVNERLPLLITLRSFSKSMTAQQLINNALLEEYKLPFVGSAFEVFQEFNIRGKLLLILDGFDEMARQVDYQTVVDNFWELANLVKDDSKVIMTCRTEHFRWAKESEKILSGKEYGRRKIVLSPPNFEVLYIEPLNNDQIYQLITKRFGQEVGPSLAERILKNANLAEMARKPVMIELLVAALDDLKDSSEENLAKVYLYATNKLLLRNIDNQRTFTSTADKLYFLCELAWEMISKYQLQIHYNSIPNRIKICFGEKIKDQHELDTWDFDLRSQTLLHRNAAGYYEFAHKSLAEYFVAFKFAAELGCLAPVFIQTYLEEDGKQCKIQIEQKNIMELAKTFGLMSIRDVRMQAINIFLVEMVTKNTVEHLLELIHETRGKSLEQVNYAGGNIASLLVLIGESLEGKDFSGTILKGADLSGADLPKANLSWADLTEADLTEADLIGAYLSRASLIGADLTDANLSQAYLIEANLFAAILFAADLTEAKLIGAYLSGADLSGANLIGADLTDANLSQAYLIEANLSGAKLIGADLAEAKLIGTDLSGANLTEANLTGTIFKDTILDGVIWGENKPDFIED